MKLMKRATALLLCFLMLTNGPISAFATEGVSDNDVVVETTATTETVEVCEECGGSDAHSETCSFNIAAPLTTETPDETTEPITTPTEITEPATTPTVATGPAISTDPVGCTECNQTEGHLDSCSQYVAPTEETVEPTTTPTEAPTEPTVSGNDVVGCTECGQTEGHTTECSQYEAPVEDIAETSGPQVGDKIWIKHNSYVYKNQSAENGHKLLLNYEVEIVNIITDENGNAVWYEFEFTTAGIGEWLIREYKYVQAENTSVEEPEPSEPIDENACNCGENAPENIADHADSCPRKQYIKTLFESKTAEEIYAQWENYDEATQSDLLNMLQKWDNAKYEELEKLVDGTPDGEKETTVGDISLKLQGVPEDVTLNAQAVTPKSYHEDLFDVVGSKKVVFAIDINLTNESGEWQPAEGEPVTVTLDAASLGLSEGERIGILHDHDGALNDLGICTVTDGKLTFTTDGFSVFYGYTVDFEYDGTWHSISGGSDILLSELFTVLNIKHSVNEVVNVEFSDNSLLSLGHLTYIKEEGGGQDYILKSIAPFSTEELLTVTLASGETLVINVFDKAWANENIDGNETWVNGDTHGNRTVTKNSTITINDGATVTMNGYILVNPGVTLTIKCNGTATLVRGSSNTQPLFNVQGGTLKITGGQIILDGKNIVTANPAILIGDYDNNSNVSTVELSKVTIQNFNSTNGGYGGAISTRGGTGTNKPIFALTVTDCKINNCKARDGSAIYFKSNSRGKATITRTVIENCYATGHQNEGSSAYVEGGTIRSNGNNGSLVELNQCIIRNNKSLSSTGDTTYGGGIYWNAAADLPSNVTDSYTTSNKRAKMYIFDCQIYGNEATGSGGGIFNESSMEIGTKYSDGFITTPDVNVGNIKGTLIYGNTSGTNGGGIGIPSYGGGAAEHQSMGVTMNLGKGVYLLSNKAVNGGGLSMNIHNTDDIGQGQTFAINYDGAVIQGNTASNNGGGIYIKMATNKYIADLNLIGGSISGNNAKNGGGIYVENTNINIGTEQTTTDNPIKIQNNTASVDGGGIYLNQTTVYGNEAIINVSNGLITTNVATRNGGGIYQTGTVGNCVVSGEGDIVNNSAANGGGIYIAGGSKLAVTGGIITDNHAVGSSDAATAKDSACGVGGGIYVHTGSFSMSGDSVGLHSNTASVAANDAYASGTNTTLVLPDVEKMNLAGWNGTGNPEGWFADYKASDSNYPANVIVVDGYVTANPGRYNYYDEDKVEVDYTTVLSTNTNTYYCLTIGTPHPGYGNLVITKTLTAPAKETQTFIFEVTGTTRKPETAYSLTVTLVIEKGATEAQVLVANIPDGTYTVTEKEAWSWRYDQTSREFHPKDGAVISETTFTVAIENPEWFADFTNKRTDPFWLSGDSYCENWWGGTGETKIEKREEHE